LSCSCSIEGSHNCIDIVPIFHSLTNEEKLEVAKITTDKIFHKGEIIYFAGEQMDKLFVIHEGQVKISRLSASGKEQVIRVLGPGDFMGELSLFSSVHMSDNAETVEKTRVCLIEGYKLKELMTTYPTITFHIMEEISNRLDKAETLIENINLHSVEHRLAEALVEMADGKNMVSLKTTKAVFASQLGMTQETLSRKLTVFQEKGYIKLEGQRKIILLNVEELKNS